MNTESDYPDQLNKVMNHTYFSYKGVLVESLIGGYRWQGVKYNSLQEIDQKINEAKMVIQQSIKK